ncbi:putative autophagy-related 12 variant 1 [Cardiosporidium cionae]|uniref:Ubiquitin-like protein ATG12 n=1 Tax=Cardiosporidium cionae TaxID=476202 RepID=A0ABQ7J4Z5_9APIC|nr:putative autophagy-related 12 variant 1 [Cardiosporidium cionae]|eukprot:KAF8818745.1 putative autophagy-related 12 variant 1 [Cardiosporidium cionae]
MKMQQRAEAVSTLSTSLVSYQKDSNLASPDNLPYLSKLSPSPNLLSNGTNILRSYSPLTSSLSFVTITTAPQLEPSWNLDAFLMQKRHFRVTIFVTSIGNASKLNRKKFRIEGNSKFEEVIQYLRRALLRTEDLFLYINNFIMPQPDDYVADLFDVFKVSESLKVSYSFSVAY